MNNVSNFLVCQRKCAAFCLAISFHIHVPSALELLFINQAYCLSCILKDLSGTFVKYRKGKTLKTEECKNTQLKTVQLEYARNMPSTS